MTEILIFLMVWLVAIPAALFAAAVRVHRRRTSLRLHAERAAWATSAPSVRRSPAPRHAGPRHRGAHGRARLTLVSSHGPAVRSLERV